jgi:hypothetical protein
VLEPFGVQPIHPLATVEPDTDQAGFLEYAQVSRRRRPRMIEPSGDRAGRHLAATRCQDGQNGAARLVRQRAEDEFEILQVGNAARLARHAFSCTGS